jgi:osmoprotectant transport system substrate-binding protein/osmoprotectant transport system permease protein
MKFSFLVIALISLFLPRISRADETVRVGSKRFTESYLLAEIVVALITSEGAPAKHEQGLGATAVAFRALEDGQIDALPEYTGTLAEAIVQSHDGNLESLRAALAPRGFSISDPIGFQNTYALAVTKNTAARLALHTTSDLTGHQDLRYGLSYEFVGRSDGWPGLASKYDLHPKNFSSMDHALSYEAIAGGSEDVIDVYTTDAKITRYDLITLADDRAYFPRYDAVLVYKSDLPNRVPTFARVLKRLPNLIDQDAMQKMNARAELDHIPFAQVAADFLAARNGKSISANTSRVSFMRGLADSIAQYGPRHLELVSIALFLSTLLGVPLGILAYTKPRAGGAILAITGVVQTIPSLALFCFFIPVLGIGIVPALAALFLYGLLPIVRNTHAGLSSIAGDLREAGVALGLTTFERLRYVELPLASRTILAGVKTSAVVAVGSATIAAFIGAGGFGEPISTGLSLNDVPTILQGAVPAAGLALLVQGFFELIETKLTPRALR